MAFVGHGLLQAGVFFIWLLFWLNSYCTCESLLPSLYPTFVCSHSSLTYTWVNMRDCLISCRVVLAIHPTGTHGGKNLKMETSPSCSTRGKGNSPRRTLPTMATCVLGPAMRMSQTPTACTTWLAMCGSGLPEERRRSAFCVAVRCMRA